MKIKNLFTLASCFFILGFANANSILINASEKSSLDNLDIPNYFTNITRLEKKSLKKKKPKVTHYSVFKIKNNTNENVWPQDMKNEARTLLTQVANTWMNTEAGAIQTEWAWGQGVLTYGLFLASQSTNDIASSDRYKKFIMDHAMHHQQENKKIDWSDKTTPAIAAINLLLQDNSYIGCRPIIDRTVDYIMGAPRSYPKGFIKHLGTNLEKIVQLGKIIAPGVLTPDAWVDSLFHIVLTLSKYTELTGDPRYRNEAVKQILVFSKYLQDSKSNLFTHAYVDRGKGFFNSIDIRRDREIPAYNLNQFWARGNSWVIVSMVELLNELPASDTVNREKILSHLLPLEAALRLHQDSKTGLFHTLLRDKSTYLETAGSAMILYGMAKGVNTGVFGEETKQAVIKGFNGLKGVLKNENGKTIVTGTSTGTNPIAFIYRITPTKDQVTYGVGGWLMAASEIAGIYNSNTTNITGISNGSNKEIAFKETLLGKSKENSSSKISLTNPVKNQIVFSETISKLSIYDSAGIEILKNSSFNNNKIDVANLKTGIYFIKMETENVYQTTKLIKE